MKLWREAGLCKELAESDKTDTSYCSISDTVIVAVRVQLLLMLKLTNYGSTRQHLAEKPLVFYRTTLALLANNRAQNKTFYLFHCGMLHSTLKLNFLSYKPEKGNL